jgi:hypothetical protein
MYGLIGLGVMLPAVVAAAVAIGQSNAQPANKVVAAGGKTEVVAPQEEVTLLQGTIKTSKPTDLMFSTALECSILTQLKTSDESQTANAEGTVRGWIEVDDKIVSLNQVSSPPQDPNDPATHNGNDTDKVTFCNREYQRTVTDDEDPLDGQDIEDDYIRTKASHAFNWVQMNLGSGVHKIELVADLETNTAGEATAQAVVGNRSLIVEPTKMANNAVISEQTAK